LLLLLLLFPPLLPLSSFWSPRVVGPSSSMTAVCVASHCSRYWTLEHVYSYSNNMIYIYIVPLCTFAVMRVCLDPSTQ
jgi:hypothetical protein